MSFFRVPILLSALLMVPLLAAAKVAENTSPLATYRAAVGAFYAQTADYNGKATQSALYATWFWQDIARSTSVPFDLEAFYSRSGALGISSSWQKESGMNKVQGGRILKERDMHFLTADAFIAHETMPVWAGVSVTHLNRARQSYSDGSRFEADSDTQLTWSLGWYITPKQNVDIRYSKEDATTLWGLGVSGYTALDQGRFFGWHLQYDRADSDSLRLNVENNTILNLYGIDRRVHYMAIGVTFYPAAHSGISYRFTNADDADNDLSSRSHAITAHWHFDTLSRLSLGYTYREHYQVLEYDMPEAHIVSVSVSQRF